MSTTTTSTTMPNVQDAWAAAIDGLLPEHLTRFYLDGVAPAGVTASDLYDECDAYVAVHGLTGHFARVLAERGVVDRCPEWCVEDHDREVRHHPDDEDSGRTHVAVRWHQHGESEVFGNVTVTVAATAGATGLSPIRVDVSPEDGFLQLPLDRVTSFIGILTEARDLAATLTDGPEDHR